MRKSDLQGDLGHDASTPAKSAKPSDDELQENFVRLLTDNQRRLHAYIQALLPSRTDADDVMQETNLALWRKWADFDQSRDLSRWAYGIAYIEVLRYRKKHATKRLLFDEELIKEIADEVLRQSDAVDQRHDALAECLGKLNEKDRELISHRYREGVTAVQVAEDLGRPTSTVYKALTRIRRALHSCIQRRVASRMSP